MAPARIDKLVDLIGTLWALVVLGAAPWWLLRIAQQGVSTGLLYVSIPIWIGSSLGFFWLATYKRGSWTAQTTVLPITNRMNIVLTLLAATSQLLGAFALLYWLRSVAVPASFNEPLSKVDATYFATTVFSTTGFGDIHAVDGGVRLLVTPQMWIGFLLISVLLVLVMSRAVATLRE